MCVCSYVYVGLFVSFAACADGYLTPCIRKYVSGFASGFKNPVSYYGTF